MIAIAEAKAPTYNLDAIPADRGAQAAAFARTKMHLWFMGEIHRTVTDVARDTHNALMTIGDRPVELSDMGAVGAVFARSWEDWIQWYTKTIHSMIGQAAAVSYGPVALIHDRDVLPYKDAGDVLEVVRPPIQPPDHGALELLRQVRTKAIEPRVYDRTGLSGRIWRLDRATRKQIDTGLAKAVANGMTPWDTSKLVEGYLGAGRDCPRWTSARLSQANPLTIVKGDPTGLIRGGRCNGQGVAYNALRLARTELQYSANLMTQELHKLNPWVEAEMVNLSPNHPKPDICDDVAGGGELGNGIYPIGDISLPLHPNCLCYLSAELIDPETFNKLMRDYLRGGSPAWPAMGNWASFVGGSI